MKTKYLLAIILLVASPLFFIGTAKVSADTATDEQIQVLQAEIEQLNQQLIELSNDPSLPADPYISYIKNNNNIDLNSVDSINNQLNLLNQ